MENGPLSAFGVKALFVPIYSSDGGGWGGSKDSGRKLFGWIFKIEFALKLISSNKSIFFHFYRERSAFSFCRPSDLPIFRLPSK